MIVEAILCNAPDCDKPVKARKLCAMHYARFMKYGDFNFSKYRQPKPMCAVDDCDKIAETHVPGYCMTHYIRFRKYGDPLYTKRTPPVFGIDICIVKSCNKPRKGQYWCSMHYSRWRAYGSTEKRERIKKHPPGLKCNVDECELQAKHEYMCDNHYRRTKVYGDPYFDPATPIKEFCREPSCRNRAAKFTRCWKHYREISSRLKEQQESCCAICTRHVSEVPRGQLLLDHDHATGEPRGMLCHNCNTALGHFRDNTAVLAAAISYITSYMEASQ